MSQRLTEMRPAGSLAERGPQPAVGRAAVVVVGMLLMGALAFDMISGRWIGAAGWHVVAALGATLPLLLLPPARQMRALQLALVYVFGLFIYTILRSFADQTAVPIRSEYVITIDRTLFFGHEPTQWLQAHLFSPVQMRPLDWLAVQTHWSYFLLPHAGAMAVYLWRRPLFGRYVALVLGTFYAGLAVYFLLPTAPPWLAADRGLLPGVSRVMDYAGGRVDTDSYHRLYDALGVPNPVAAMPSLHMAVTFALFLFTRRVNRWLAATMLVYVLLMGFSLVYLGEHYVTDVLAGILTASGAFLLTERLATLRTAAAAAAPSAGLSPAGRRSVALVRRSNENL